MNHASLFSGIGGFDLAAEWMGWNNVLSCEIDPFCNKILQYHFPNAVHIGDIKQAKFKRDDRGNVYLRRIVAYTGSDTTGQNGDSDTVSGKRGRTIQAQDEGRKGEAFQYKGCGNISQIEEEETWQNLGTIDILTGGFPCQPFSLAGKRRGTDDDRHLWPEMLRAIREIKPRWVVGENVYGFTNWNGGVVFREVLSDLENEGYEVQPFIIPACAVNAPHRRDRVWIVAYATNGRKWELQPAQGRKNTPEIRGKDSCNIRCRCQNGINSNNTNSGIEGLQQWKNGIYGFGVIADTDISKRSEGGLYQNRGQAERHTGTLNARDYERGTWHNFPTQPPLRGRNDGIPGELDGITVSKLRNESIKCYGNAIVPQVALQIFKAIQQYETLTCKQIQP